MFPITNDADFDEDANKASGRMSQWRCGKRGEAVPPGLAANGDVTQGPPQSQQRGRADEDEATGAGRG